MGAAAGVGAALGLNEKQLVDALGIAGSMASGIIEYLAEGTWTKRMHAGWAAQSGLRAALLAGQAFADRAPCSRAYMACSTASRIRREATTPRCIADFGAALGDRDTGVQALSVRDHGASVHRLRRAACGAGVKPDDIKDMVCEIGEGHCASAVGAARRQAAPDNAIRGEILGALSHCGWVGARQCWLRGFHRSGRRRSGGAGRRSQGEVRRRSEQSVPEQFHRPCPRHAQRRSRDRGAAAAFARRRARTADAARHRGQVQAQCAARRLERAAGRRGAGDARQAV